VNAVR